MMVIRLAAEDHRSALPPEQRCRRGVLGGRMSYTPHIGVDYRLAAQGELSRGLSVDIGDQIGARAAIVLDPGECRLRLTREITALSMHQIVHGTWRQRWTEDERMRGPAQGLGLAISRWERVPGRMIPYGRSVYGVEENRSCVWLVDEDDCTNRIQNDMNDLLLRLAGDGLWIQCWPRFRPLLSGTNTRPLLAPLTLA